ncbi:hypothetical protein [Methylomonas rapida]|uniref:Uncharacterized protein n=1 Tax=Methylomonas rapida TaxID=2963939 RepID=A0ABY7GJ63_9GAMM|nr:hypothetical protein [Methylomonas rapida]WAR44716.1 hypothetical protein NM686_020635 [Methylomonas rapida]
MKDKLFELDDVLEALGLEKRSDFWWRDLCKKITRKGFFPKYLNERDEDLLSDGPELDEMRKLLKNLKLELPCTREQLIDWAERCGFDDVLPEEFFEEAEVGETVSQSEYEQRLKVLEQWLIHNDYAIGCKLPKHFTVRKMYDELGQANGNLFLSLNFGSFERHFWKKQKLCSLTRGRKDTVT